jgi:dTDP-glucose 4,6-dehydratase
MRLLVTGGAGFIGSNFARMMLAQPDVERVAVLDALTYAGNLSTIRDLREHPNFAFYPGKIQDSTAMSGVLRAEESTHVVNFAAETHNDRSLLDPGSFIQTDVFGVHVLLEACNRFGVERIVHVSTDEVYGSILDGSFTESSPLNPNTPYSASKAGGDLQIRAHHISFGTPALITRGGNTYGPWQYPEKLVPFFITRMLRGKKAPLYGDGSQVREWIHVEDHCRGIEVALRRGEVGHIYNVGDSNERTNLQVSQIILNELGKDDSWLKRIPDPRRKAHDQRYSMQATKLRELGWRPAVDFERGLRETVAWYRDHEDWWRPIVESAPFQEFEAKFYGPVLGEDL